MCLRGGSEGQRERGNEEEIEIDRYCFGLDNSVSPVLLNAIMKDSFLPPMHSN